MRFRHLLVLGACGLVAARAEEPPSTLAELGRDAERELRTNILPFWLQHARNHTRGGFFGLIAADLRADPDAARGSLLTSRILWAFSAAYHRYGDPAYLEMAEWAYDDLVHTMLDPRHGGVFWSVRADGTPLDTRKHIYAEVFAIYALAEFHRTGAPAASDALAQAIAIHRALETHAHDRVHGGYFEEMDRAWNRQGDLGPRRRLMGGEAPKSQNAHLHILEAYTNLYRVWPDAGLRQDLRELADVMLTRVLDPATHHLRLFLDDDWTPRSDEISFGHDIEFSWLICETAETLEDPGLISRARAEAVAIAAACLREGVDADGGMFNTAGPRGLRDTNKDWWPQAEAVTGFINAWQLSHEARFLIAACRTWGFIEHPLVNREKGEWYRSTDRAGHPDRSSPPASMWKCPYHNSRACLQAAGRAQGKPAASAGVEK